MTVPLELVQEAVDTVRAAFRGEKRIDGLAPDLEKLLGIDRNEWGVHLLRSIADTLLENAEARLRTPQYEMRWFNLVGFTLRPGFGAAGDEWRVKQLWKTWFAGVSAKRHIQLLAEWWVCWRRVAGGLRPGHQQQIGSGLVKELVPRQGGSPLGPGKKHRQEAAEMWRCLGAMERLPVKTKLKVLRALLEKGRRLEPYHFWVIARLGARRLFHGPADAVVPAARMRPLLPALYDAAGKHKATNMPLLAVANVCRLCGIRDLDFNDIEREQAVQYLKEHNAPDEYWQQLQHSKEDSRVYQSELIGDALPLGLALVQD